MIDKPALDALRGLIAKWREKAGDLRHDYAPSARLQEQRFPTPPSPETADLLKRIVIAFDAEQDEELDAALTAARAHLGLKLMADADEVLEVLRGAEDEV